MKHKLTAFLILVLVIAVRDGKGETAQDDDPIIAEESKSRAITVVEGPKNVFTSTPEPTTTKPEVQTHKPEQRPPSKPPIFPDKPTNPNIFVDLQRPFFGQMPPSRPYTKTPMKLHHSTNSIYQYPRVIPLSPHHKNHFYIKQSMASRPMHYVPPTNTMITTKPPKFSIPVQTIKGVRTDAVKPPINIVNTTTSTTTTTTETTTTAKVLRTKRIWPKKVVESNSSAPNTSFVSYKTKNNTTNERDYETAASHHRVRVVHRHSTPQTTTQPTTKRRYRPVTRVPKRPTTALPSPANFTEKNDWIPIVPSHYPKINKNVKASRRSDSYAGGEQPPRKELMYLQSFGLLPLNSEVNANNPNTARKKMVFFKRKRQLNPYYSGYSAKPAHSHPVVYGDLQPEETKHPPVITKIKHHHHHHHHKYIKTVEKKVPYKVEVPKPYPVAVETKVPVPVETVKVVEKQVPYPVTVEKKVPYPIGIKVPHPVPVKVVEKEYVPKPYPVVHHVPFVRHVQVKVPQPVPVEVEKRVPYPVEVKVAVPVDRPVPVRVEVEKQVPYPVPVRVLVPQPYPVEKRVPYPVRVKEQVEVIKHVPVRVPYPQPYPVKVPHPVPVPVEKRVPYPVEVEKKVPVPVEVFVPQRIEVEKKVPVYVPKPYPVEKKVPYPVKVPVPVKVAVPVEIPVYIHDPFTIYDSAGPGVTPDTATTSSVSVQGNTATYSFQSRSDSDVTETTTTAKES